MDFTKFRPLSLFFLQISLLSAHLEPPSNVTLDCRNLSNILTWNYSENTTGLRFRVDISSLLGSKYGCPQPLWIDQPPLEANVSCFSDPRNSYHLTVTAVNGDSESVSKAITFSYKEKSFSEQKCYLDLPAVEISPPSQHQAHLRFPHPCLLYHIPGCRKSGKRRHELKNPLPAFKYTIEVISTGQTFKPMCEEEQCIETLDMSDEKEYCLKIEGELELMTVKSPLNHCIPPPPSPPSYTLVFILVILAAIAAVALIGFMVYHKFTRPSSPLPFNIARPIQPHHPLKPEKDFADQLSCSDPEPSSPTLLLPATEEDCQGNASFANGSSEDNLRMQIGMPSRDDGAPDDMEQRSSNGFRSPYMDGTDLEGNNSGTVLSDYESRAAVV